MTDMLTMPRTDQVRLSIQQIEVLTDFGDGTYGCDMRDVLSAYPIRLLPGLKADIEHFLEVHPPIPGIGNPIQNGLRTALVHINYRLRDLPYQGNSAEPF